MDASAGSTIAWVGPACGPVLKAVGYLAGAHVPPPYFLILIRGR